jgi:6-phosphofructokinase 1
LNTVIRETVHALKYLYGAKNVWGVVGGFNGFLGKEGYEPILLTNELVENIHHEGGTILRSSRGGFDEQKILDFLRQKNIQQLYVIGGDGTHRAAYKIRQACQLNQMNVAIAGIPKTIDNDCGFIDRSFGFLTAVEAAQNSIRTAKTGAYFQQQKRPFGSLVAALSNYISFLDRGHVQCPQRDWYREVDGTIRWLFGRLCRFGVRGR